MHIRSPALITLLTILTLSVHAAELTPADITTAPAKEETFVNPLFYQPMEGTSYKINFEPDLVIITPTSYYVQNFYGYDITVPCEMLENTIDTVALKCLIQPADKNDTKTLILNDYDSPPTYWTYKFVIMNKDEQTSTKGTYILEYSYYKDETEWSSLYPYFIYNEKENYRKQWGDLIDKHFRELHSE